jgi:hypothetical protein
MVAPGWILGFLAAERTPTTEHFFGIVGMFMLIVGGLAFHALLGKDRDPVVFLWASLQKFGASAAVGLGVFHKLFGTIALLVAGVDLLSGFLFLLYWRKIRASPGIRGYAQS